MDLENIKDSGGAKEVFPLLKLPPELRALIWTSLVASDIEEQVLLRVKYGHWPVRPLTSLNLRLVSRQLKDEVTTTFYVNTIYLQSSEAASGLLGHRMFARSKASMYSTNPAIIFKARHVSLLPNRPLYRNKLADGSLVWYYKIDRRSTLYFSSACPDGWRNTDGEMAYFIRMIRTRGIHIRSLEIPALFCLHGSVVRNLRRLREVALHFAFIPESTKPEELTLEEGPTPEHRREWLGETGDTDIVLPVYETNTAILPVAVVPFASFLAAIRREAASREPIPIPDYPTRTSPPLWIDLDDNYIAASNSLSPPSSGWFKYVVRDPGVCCLEQTSPPTPLPPLRRKELKLYRREMWQRRHRIDFIVRRDQVDIPRIHSIKQNGIRGVIIKEKVVRPVLAVPPRSIWGTMRLFLTLIGL